MPIRYLEAKVSSRTFLKDTFERLAGSVGASVGGVAGVSEDGRLLALLDVASSPQAPPGQDETWWTELRSACAHTARVELVTEARPFVSNVPTRSGFAQMIRARVSQRARFERVLAEDAEWLVRERPEVLGGTLAWHDEDRFTLVVCFTDESSARAGEAKNAGSPGADIEQLMHDVSYQELLDPWTRPL